MTLSSDRQIGTISSSDPVRWKFCPQCGTRLELHWQFCAQCGTEIGRFAHPWNFIQMGRTSSPMFFNPMFFNRPIIDENWTGKPFGGTT